MIEVNLNVEQINEYVVKAIVGSAIGKNINDAINKLLNEKPAYNQKTLIEQACHEVLRQYVLAAVREAVQSHEEEIKASIAEKITRDTIMDFVDFSFNKIDAAIQDGKWK